MNNQKPSENTNDLITTISIKEEAPDSDNEITQESPQIPPFFNFPTTSNFGSLSGSGVPRRINSFGIPFEYVPYGSQRATPDGNNLLFKGYRYYRDGKDTFVIVSNRHFK